MTTSSGDFFRRFRPRIMIEPHMVQGALSDQAVVRILDCFGYECRIIEQHGVKISADHRLATAKLIAD